MAAALTTLAVTSKEIGEFERAQRLYARVEQIRQNAGATDRQLADLHHNLAGLAYARRRYRAAERHARRAVALRHTAGADAVTLAADRAVLAAALVAVRDFDEARRLLDQALAACRAAKPPRRYEVAVQLHNLAALDAECGQAERAEELYREALAIKEELLGRRAFTIAEERYPQGHPTTTGILHNLDAPPPPQPAGGLTERASRCSG